MKGGGSLLSHFPPSLKEFGPVLEFQQLLAGLQWELGRRVLRGEVFEVGLPGQECGASLGRLFRTLNVLLEAGFAGLLASPCAPWVCAPGFKCARHHYRPVELGLGGTPSRETLSGLCHAGRFPPLLLGSRGFERTKKVEGCDSKRCRRASLLWGWRPPCLRCLPPR